jgi:hypothetical protein
MLSKSLRDVTQQPRDDHNESSKRHLKRSQLQAERGCVVLSGRRSVLRFGEMARRPA